MFPRVVLSSCVLVFLPRISIQGIPKKRNGCFSAGGIFHCSYSVLVNSPFLSEEFCPPPIDAFCCCVHLRPFHPRLPPSFSSLNDVWLCFGRSVPMLSPIFSSTTVQGLACKTLEYSYFGERRDNQSHDVFSLSLSHISLCLLSSCSPFTSIFVRACRCMPILKRPCLNFGSLLESVVPLCS